MTTHVQGVTLWLALWRAADAVGGHARRDVARQGLCYTDFAVLEALMHKGPLPVNVIGRLVLLTSGAITTAVDRLEARGLVERLPHPTDRRARMVRLTTAGHEFMRVIWAEHQVALEEAAAALDPNERRTLFRLLLKLKRGASAADAGTVTTTIGTDAIGTQTPISPEEGSS
jgi:Transcriptional regulators